MTPPPVAPVAGWPKPKAMAFNKFEDKATGSPTANPATGGGVTASCVYHPRLGHCETTGLHIGVQLSGSPAADRGR